MPSKSKRVASRQAQLRRRKRKIKGQSQEFHPGPSESSTEAVAASEPADEAIVQEETIVEASAPASQPATRQVRRSRQRSTAEPALAYSHLSSELRHIGSLAVLMVAALVVLTVFLRS